MKHTKILMGMPVSIEIRDQLDQAEQAITQTFEYFEHVDQVFSTYKPDSEISKINRGELRIESSSAEMQEVFRLSEQTRLDTDGYFNILTPQGSYDPSGLVKGWAISNAAKLLKKKGFKYFFVDAGGDIQATIPDNFAQKWRVGIRNPFNDQQVVKVLEITNGAVATSGTYIRGNHIYNPLEKSELQTEIVSLTVVGPEIYDADRFATAAFAMGKKGIEFIEGLKGFEGYQIDKNGRALFTSGFNSYVIDA